MNGAIMPARVGAPDTVNNDDKRSDSARGAP